MNHFRRSRPFCLHTMETVQRELVMQRKNFFPNETVSKTSYATEKKILIPKRQSMRSVDLFNRMVFENEFLVFTRLVWVVLILVVGTLGRSALK